MYTSANDILMVIGLDFSLFILLLIGFSLHRRFRSKSVNLSIEITVLHPYMNEAEHPFLEILKKLRDMELDDIHSEMGEWAYMYLSLHKFMLICVIAIALPGTTGLLLIYYYGSDEGLETESIHTTGISHIIDDPELLIYPILFLVYFSLVIYVLGFKFLSNMLKSRTSDKSLRTQNTVVMVKSIQKHYDAGFVTECLKKSLDHHFKNSVQSIYSVPYHVESYSSYKKLKNNERKLKLLNLDYELNAHKTMIRKRCKKVDGISYYEMKKHKNITKMNDSRERFKGINSGVAFVLFSNSVSAKEFIMSGVDPLDNVKTSNWECVLAPVPHDIIWENIGVDRHYAILMKIFLNLIYILVFLVVVTPSAFEQQLLLYLDYLNLTNFVLGTLAISLPALVLVIYQLIILPPAVNFLVKKEKHTKKHTRVTSSLKKYFFFLLFYTLVFPILQLQLTGVIELLIDKDWQHVLGNRVKYTGELFFVFMIHQTFLKNGFDLLVASKYVLSAAKAIFLAQCKAEKALCFEAEPFEFDFELAVSLNAFVIMCGLSVIFPLILIPGFMFFAIRVIFI